MSWWRRGHACDLHPYRGCHVFRAAAAEPRPAVAWRSLSRLSGGLFSHLLTQLLFYLGCVYQ